MHTKHVPQISISHFCDVRDMMWSRESHRQAERDKLLIEVILKGEGVPAEHLLKY